MHKPDIIRMMEDAVLKAGRGLSRDFGEIENLQVSKKGPKDFVTSADHKSEKILIEELQKIRPNYGFLIEESGKIEGKDEKYRWICDPLDGTHNFMHGIPHFSISLALEETVGSKKEIIAAVVHSPATGELFWAEKGTGAFIDRRRLTVSARTDLDEALLATCFNPREDQNEAMDAIKDISSSARIFGSAALDLAYVAAGKIDVFWHDKLQPWDIAAGVLLVREARGVVTHIDGSTIDLEKGNILAGNSPLHEKICSTLSKYYVKR